MPESENCSDSVQHAISRRPAMHEQNKILKLLLFRHFSVNEPDADH